MTTSNIDDTREMNMKEMTAAALAEADGAPAEAMPEQMVSLANIKVAPNPRGTPSAKDVADLAESIRRHGLLHAVVVQTGAGKGEFSLIAGQRRFLAVRLLAEKYPTDARWKTIRASVQDHHKGARVKVVQAVENLKRQDLTLAETVTLMMVLRDDEQMTDEQIANDVGYSKGTVQKYLRIGDAPLWLRGYASSVEVSVPVLDDEGEPKIVNGAKEFATKRVPGFAFSDLVELVAFYRDLDKWDHEQQKKNTGHRAKAEPETTRIAKKFATSGTTGDRLKAGLKAKLAEIKGAAAAPPPERAEKKAYEITTERISIDLKSVKPLTVEEQLMFKPMLAEALHRLGYGNVSLEPKTPK